MNTCLRGLRCLGELKGLRACSRHSGHVISRGNRRERILAEVDDTTRRPPWLEAQRTLRAYGLRGDDAASRRNYRIEMELACRECLRGELTEEDEEARRTLLRGGYIGEPSFGDRILDSLDRAVKNERGGKERPRGTSCVDS